MAFRFHRNWGRSPHKCKLHVTGSVLPAGPRATQPQPRVVAPSSPLVVRATRVATASPSQLHALLHRLDLSPAQHAQLLDAAASRDPNTQQQATTTAADNLGHLLATYNRSRVKLLLLRHPTLLTSSTPLADWSGFLTTYGFTTAEVYALLDAAGAALPHLDPFTVGQLLLTLQHHGLAPPEIRTRVLLPFPPILGVPPAQLSALLAALARLGCTHGQLHDLILHHPRVLATASHADLRAKLRHLRCHGVRERCVSAFLPHVIPHFLAEKEDAAATKLEYLHSIGAHGEALERLLAACPVLWTLAVTDVMDKWGFLTHVMGLQLRDVLRFPRALERDLMCCIRPRFLLLEHVLDAGPAAAAAAIGHGVAQHGVLAWLLDCDDVTFCDRVGVSMAEYLGFYNDLVANQYYGVKAAVDIHDRPEPRKG